MFLVTEPFTYRRASLSVKLSKLSSVVSMSSFLSCVCAKDVRRPTPTDTAGKLCANAGTPTPSTSADKAPTTAARRGRSLSEPAVLSAPANAFKSLELRTRVCTIGLLSIRNASDTDSHDRGQRAAVTRERGTQGGPRNT